MELIKKCIASFKQMPNLHSLRNSAQGANWLLQAGFINDLPAISKAIVCSLPEAANGRRGVSDVKFPKFLRGSRINEEEHLKI